MDFDFLEVKKKHFKYKMSSAWKGNTNGSLSENVSAAVHFHKFLDTILNLKVNNISSYIKNNNK